MEGRPSPVRRLEPPRLTVMAIRINLLAEAQSAEETRRKNPVKLAIWVGSFLVALVVLFIVKLQLDIVFSKKSLNAAEQSWKENNDKYKAVTNNIARTAEMDKKLAALERLTTNRFYWAPVLNALQQTIIRNIQVIRVQGEQKYTKEDSKTTGTGANKVTKPGGMVEKNSLYVDAKDFDPNAQNYDKFKETLSGFDFFGKLLGPRNAFILDGTLSAPSVDPTDATKQFVVFRLASHFTEVRRE
jgi:hypothetical protein